MGICNHDSDHGARSHNIRRFLIERELADRWRKSTRTLRRMRADGTGPAYHRIGGSILYLLADIERFEAAGRVVGGAA